MSLPVITAPTYELKLFSLPKPIKYRPYLVKEEKILLMAQGATAKEAEVAVQQVITACTNGAVNAAKLPSFDLEMLFLHLRARSVNNIIEVKYECQRPVPSTNPEPEQCGELVPFVVNIDDIKLTVAEGHTNKVWLNDTVGITMLYPVAAVMEDLLSAQNDPDKLIAVIAQCIETVFTKDGEVTEAKEQTPEALSAFVEGMTIPQIAKIREFFETMPRLTHTLDFKCPKCQHEEPIVLEGMQDFFD